MKGLLLKNGDVVRENGALVVISGLDFYKQRIQNRILLCLGECVYAPSSGTDWISIFNSDSKIDRMKSEIQNRIEEDSETVSVSSISITQDSNRHVAVTIAVLSIYGQTTITQGVSG